MGSTDSTDTGESGDSVDSVDSGDSGDSSDSDGEDGPLDFFAEDTLLVWDWDDTVLPSTWLSEQGLGLESAVSQEQRAVLDRLAERAAQTLSVAKRHGNVVLVTNAEEGWIELSSQKFVPALVPVLADIKILSARSTYEHQGLRSPFEWKFLAFESVIGSFCAKVSPGRRKNVISFGDSGHEREALIRVADSVPNCCTKSLKFVEKPGIQQLLKEHDLIGGCFRYIVNYDGNLDVDIGC